MKVGRTDVVDYRIFDRYYSSIVSSFPAFVIVRYITTSICAKIELWDRTALTSVLLWSCAGHCNVDNFFVDF